MERDNIGKFIKEQRNKVNMTQQELADYLNITRENLSKWERGIAVPNTEYLDPLCKALHVSLTELLSGKTETDSNRFILSLFDKNIKQRRKFLKIIISIILLSVLSFLTYYFIDNYNSVKLYTINQDENGIILHDSLILVLKDKGYFIFNDIRTENENNIKKITVYYYDENDEKIVLYKSDKISKVIKFKSDNKILSNILDKTYMEVETETSSLTTHLIIRKKIANDLLIESPDIENNKSTAFTFYDYTIPNLDKFTYDSSNEIYKYKDKNIEIEYSLVSKSLTLFTNYDDTYEKFTIIGESSNHVFYNKDANIICYYNYVEHSFKNQNCEIYENRIISFVEKYFDFIEEN